MSNETSLNLFMQHLNVLSGDNFSGGVDFLELGLLLFAQVCLDLLDLLLPGLAECLVDAAIPQVEQVVWVR